MDYNHINNFFDKVKNILATKEAPYDVVKSCIKEHIKFDIDKSKIKIKGQIIYVDCSPIVKNEILMKKQNILADITKIVPQVKYIDIK